MRPRPLAEFLHEEAAGGIALLVATVVALVWANSPERDAYVSLWDTELQLGSGAAAIDLDLRHWVNDGLMALFFFVVGLEIKRELVGRRAARAARGGAARDRGRRGRRGAGADLPRRSSAGGEAAAGWAIPMATDIAFAVGVLALLGDRVSAGVKLLVLAIAIVDDIIAITVIAIFYSDGDRRRLARGRRGAARARRTRCGGWASPRSGAYVPVGLAVWVATLRVRRPRDDRRRRARAAHARRSGRRAAGPGAARAPAAPGLRVRGGAAVRARQRGRVPRRGQARRSRLEPGGLGDRDRVGRRQVRRASPGPCSAASARGSACCPRT